MINIKLSVYYYKICVFSEDVVDTYRSRSYRIKKINKNTYPGCYYLLAIEVGEPRPISINTLSTGKPDAPCKVTVTNPKGKVVELPTQKKPEGYGTVFTPTEQGPHKVNVNFAGQEVPKSPFNVTVQPKANVGAVKVKGLETRKLSMVLSLCIIYSQHDLL